MCQAAVEKLAFGAGLTFILQDLMQWINQFCFNTLFYHFEEQSNTIFKGASLIITILCLIDTLWLDISRRLIKWHENVNGGSSSCVDEARNKRE